MSTKNDKSLQQLIQIKDELLIKFNLQELQEFYNEHSTRELESYFRQNYGISCYYAEKIFVDILGFNKKTRADSKSYWLDHMKKTHEDKYGGVGFASKELAEKSYRTNEERNGSRTYVNTAKAKQTKRIRYGDENYNNSEKAIQTATSRYGGVGFASPELRQKDVRHVNSDTEVKHTRTVKSLLPLVNFAGVLITIIIVNNLKQHV